MNQLLRISLLQIILVVVALSTSAQSLIVNEVLAHNTNTTYDEFGEFDDWIEIHNNGNAPVNLKNLQLSDGVSNLDKHVIAEDLIVEPNGYIILWADGQTYQGVNHLNFKLSEGESVIISEGENIIDQLSVFNVLSNISIGKDSAFPGELLFYEIPTFGQANVNGLHYLAPVEFNLTSGFYDNAIMIGLSSEQSSNIYYTLDGSKPTTNSFLYTGNPLVISDNTILIAFAQKNGYLNSVLTANTYLYELPSTIPSLFITSPTQVINSNNQTNVHAQLVDESGEVLFEENAVSQRHGDNGQPSFRLSFGPNVGSNKIMTPLFENKPDVTGFKSLIFRQSGNDGLNTSFSKRSHLRDGMISTMVNSGKFNFKAPGFRQVSVFINGNYHGIFNMRERIDGSFLESNYKVKDVDSLCFIEYKFGVPSNVNPIEGQYKYFRDSLWILCKNQDLSDEETFLAATKHLNMDDFTDYWIHEVFVGNADWLSNNMYFWADTAGEAKFRWILWDTDIGLGFKFQNYGDPNWNSLSWSTSTESGRPWNGERTAIIRGLLTNENYRNFFINRFCDLLNTEYLTDHTIGLLDKLSDNITPEVPRHIAKWGTGSFNNWVAELGEIENYLTVRPDIVRNHIKGKFNLETALDIDVKVSLAGAGNVKLNTITLNSTMLPWNGIYFKDIPLQLTAIPNEGYQFVGWEHTSDISTTIEVTPLENRTITALFEETNTSSYEVVINEISSAQLDERKSKDWLEIYNPSTTDIDLSDWKFEDDSNSDPYSFPSGTTIEGESYMIIARNISEFQSFYPDVSQVIGDFDFGLSKDGEKLSIYDAEDALVDIVEYARDNTWPSTEGVQSISLINSESDNNEGVSWKQSIQSFGSPGQANDISIHTKDENECVLNIYPNPTIDRITLKTRKQGHLYIYDVYGRMIDYYGIFKPVTIIEFNQYVSGIYYLKYDSLDGESITKKLILL